MTDFLTTLPWGWYGLFLCLCVICVYGAAYYMACQPPRGIDYELAGIDDDVNERWVPPAALVCSYLGPIDQRSLDDWRWQGIEEGWHDFLEGFPTREEIS